MMANAHVRRVGEYAAIMTLAVAMALNYQIFILQNAFAPAGINGIATMVQYLFHFSVGRFQPCKLCLQVFQRFRVA